MRLLLVAAAIALASCSKMPWGTAKALSSEDWTHPEKTSFKDFDRDRYECERDNPSVRKAHASAMRERCMASKGWSRK